MREARRREGRRGRLPKRKEGGVSAATTPKRKAAKDFQGYREVEPPFMEEALKRNFDHKM